MKSVNALMLVGLLALSACSAPTTVTPPAAPVATTPAKPNPAKTFGLYELRVNGLSTQGDASVNRVGLSAQAAEVPFDQLSFARVSMSNLVDNVNRVVHMTASFQVTNNTGGTITLPTFIPVDTDGSYATDGQTPFRNVKTRTGAPVSAGGMAVEQGHTNSGGPIVADPAATPFLTNIDSGGVTISVPAGSTAPNVGHRGWQSAAALAPGASQIVTFGARVPLQGTDIGDNDPFSFSLVFSVADNPGTVAGLRGIHEVQGNTASGDAASPLSGTQLIEGVVTQVATGLQGFFVQEEAIDTDGIPTTSEGVFVFCGTTCPTGLVAGDRVRVSGTVSEFRRSYSYNDRDANNNPIVTVVNAPFTTTQLTSPTVTVLGNGVPQPEAISIAPNLPVAQRERFEGMRVSTSGVVTSNFTLGRFNSVDLAQTRIANFTQVNAPDVNAYSAFTATLPDQMLRVDDLTLAQNPDPLFGRNGQPLSASNTLRGGDTGTATGVLHYDHDGFGNRSGSNFLYRIMSQSATFTGTNPRTAAPDPVGGDLRVGSMNVLNYFTTLVNSNTGCTPNGAGSSSRGAENCDEFLRQQNKIVKAITGLNPDVLGILEMQNDFDKGANSSMAALVNALNAEAGAGTYAYINPARKIGTDVISVAMIYKPAAVDPVGNLAILDNTVDPTYVDTCNRPTWAQTFQSKANGGRFTAVMMHLKSKGSACSTTNDSDPGDGQGAGYIARRDAATAIVNWLATNPTGVQEDDRILMGDYNAYAQEQPLTILANGGYSNLFSASTYSYQFDSQWGSLDQATASPSMATQVTGRTKWHINADEPTVLDYNTNFKSPGQVTSYFSADPFRSSDHDPILVGVSMTAQTPLPATPQGSSISVNPTGGMNLTVGTSNTTTVGVGRSNYSGNVVLSIDSVTGSGTAPTVTVTSQPGAGTSGTLSVNAANATAGTYTVTVRGAGSGVTDATATFTVTVTAPANPNARLRISQVYPGGGANSGTPAYKNDYVEIFNAGSQAVALSGYSLQYFSAANTTTSNTFTLSGTLNPGQYYLIKTGSNGSLGADLNGADLTTSNLSMSGTAGKIALVQGTAAVSSTSSSIADAVAWGTATNTSEGVYATAPSGAQALFRLQNGCQDTNNNANDLTVQATAPRNSASPTVTCP
ncbi:ExeM/NucH family extracellular endonuclease [Deinococcus aquaedulcis]|uniref:ExeM/NucH family extracellular endonuclease n=1 Tax=Deinococcus aquaedulcis TaxID=2840455 RepID=UPI001F22302A|nr:ExeM/NucH family extracellular endonuclease [Deinococcus aquaedulcis]